MEVRCICVVKVHRNEAYMLADNEGRCLAKTWSDTNLHKYYT